MQFCWNHKDWWFINKTNQYKRQRSLELMVSAVKGAEQEFWNSSTVHFVLYICVFNWQWQRSHFPFVLQLTPHDRLKECSKIKIEIIVWNILMVLFLYWDICFCLLNNIFMLIASVCLVVSFNLYLISSFLMQTESKNRQLHAAIHLRLYLSW